MDYFTNFVKVSDDWRTHWYHNIGIETETTLNVTQCLKNITKPQSPMSNSLKPERLSVYDDIT